MLKVYKLIAANIVLNRDRTNECKHTQGQKALLSGVVWLRVGGLGNTCEIAPEGLRVVMEHNFDTQFSDTVENTRGSD